MNRFVNAFVGVCIVALSLVVGYFVWPVVIGWLVGRLVWRAYRNVRPRKRSVKSVALTYQR